MSNLNNKHFKMLDAFMEYHTDTHDITWYARIDTKDNLIISVSVDDEDHCLRTRPELLNEDTLGAFLNGITIEPSWKLKPEKTSRVASSLNKPTVSRLHCNDCECRYSEEYTNHPVCPVCGGKSVTVQQTHSWTHEDVLASYAIVHPLPEKTLRKEFQCKR
jgi:hypothetical protein